MEFKKPAISFEQQVDLLISRGMTVEDRTSAIHYLSHINYYRLEAYWLPFEISRAPHVFAPATSFNTVLNNYLFDREFRLHLLDAIERIEVSFRTQWAYHISHEFGAHGYLENSKGMRKDERRLLNDTKELQEHVQRSDEVFIKHFREAYDEPLPPAWVSCEVMSLGLLSRFYSNLRANQVRRNIAAAYQVDEGFLEGFLEHITYVRNVCAHHSRLWNRHLTKKMPLPKGKPVGLKDNIYIDASNKTEHKIYNTLVVVQHLITVISPDSLWAINLAQLIEKYSIDANRMGFPEGWQALPLWQQALNKSN
ncbi:Abi family protein [Cellvibrio sp. OA-2007]|uniref:Abi family protein n=1 Tax=Cellvibrio sp. OA-2007 TaxID=529823 RepID=UPI000783713E|nr:Abi family protein [Cellvibrio sp. OA-2007]